jgi:uncharacterized protein YggL (DUF469 family)
VNQTRKQKGEKERERREEKKMIPKEFAMLAQGIRFHHFK